MRRMIVCCHDADIEIVAVSADVQVQVVGPWTTGSGYGPPYVG